MSVNGNGNRGNAPGAMPFPLIKDYDDIIEEHSNKIEKLKDKLQDINQEVVKHTLGLEYLAQRMEDGTESIIQKIETTFNPLSDKITETAIKLSSVSDTLSDNGKIIDSIEKQRNASLAKIRTFKKIMIAAIIGAISIAIERCGSMLFSKIFH